MWLWSLERYLVSRGPFLIHLLQAVFLLRLGFFAISRPFSLWKGVKGTSGQPGTEDTLSGAAPVTAVSQLENTNERNQPNENRDLPRISESARQSPVARASARDRYSAGLRASAQRAPSGEKPFHASFITQVETVVEFPVSSRTTVNGRGKAAQHSGHDHGLYRRSARQSNPWQRDCDLHA